MNERTPRGASIRCGRLLLMLLASSLAWLPLPSTAHAQTGVEALVEVDLVGADAGDHAAGLDLVRSTLQQRLDAGGVQNASIVAVPPNQLRVVAPNVLDRATLRAILTRANLFDVREEVITPDGSRSWVPATITSPDGTARTLNGAYVSRVRLEIQPRPVQPNFVFEFDRDGQQLLTEISTRNLGRPLGLFMDGQFIMDSVVQEVISSRSLTMPWLGAIDEAIALMNRFGGDAFWSFRLIDSD